MVIIKVFLSYRWEDKRYADGLKGAFLNPTNEYRHVPYNEREDYRQKGETVIKNYLKGIIGNCDALICLIGNKTHNSPWIDYELDVATSQNKKIVSVRIQGTNGGAPNLIRSRGIKIIEYDSRKINDALSKK